MVYKALALDRLKELLLNVLERENGVLGEWDTHDGHPRVSLSMSGSPATLSIELGYEYFVLVASNGYWGLDWATLDDEASQTEAFRDLIGSARDYLQGSFRLETRHKFLRGDVPVMLLKWAGEVLELEKGTPRESGWK